LVSYHIIAQHHNQEIPGCELVVYFNMAEMRCAKFWWGHFLWSGNGDGRIIFVLLLDLVL